MNGASGSGRRSASLPAAPTPEEERIIRREGGKILDKMTPSHSKFFRKSKPRSFPSFERGEMGLGRTLGMGTFCRVAEILEIRLKTRVGEDGEELLEVIDEAENGGTGKMGEEEKRDEQYAHGREISYDSSGGYSGDDFEPSLDAAMAAADLPTGHSRTFGGSGHGSDHFRGGGGSTHSHVTIERSNSNDPAASSVGSPVTTPAFDDSQDPDQITLAQSDLLDQMGHDGHYNMTPSQTRLFMEKKCIRHSKLDGGANGPGAARYAVKRLRPDLNENERINGAIDLAVECRFLSSVYHPNIVKMRGTVGGPDPLSPGFFIVLDRLYDTLEQRIEEWDGVRRTYGGCCGGMFGSDKEELRILLADRLKVAYDVAAVFRYLHNHNLIYRDIKTDNIGFDVRGDVKVFDFGLCKELVPEERTKDGKYYKLTGLTGSFRYMAPEVALSRPYNLSADVYSYGVLLWQLLDLRHPFMDLNMSEYTDRVAKGGYRPKYSSSKKWPEKTRRIAERCMSAKPSERPVFEKIAAQVKNDLLVTSYDSNGSIANRSAHMMTRSVASGETGSEFTGSKAGGSRSNSPNRKRGSDASGSPAQKRGSDAGRSASNSDRSLTGSIGSAKQTAKKASSKTTTTPRKQ